MRKRITAAAAAAAAALFLVTGYAQDKPAAHADPKIVQEIYDCMAKGLPEGWATAWVTVRQVADTGTKREFEAEFRYATEPGDAQGKPLHPCDSRQVVKNVLALNRSLKPEQRRWTAAKLLYDSKGKFSVHYGYAAPREKAPAAPGK